MYNKSIVAYVWRNFRDLEIIRDIAPGTDREEQELSTTIRETRAAIKNLTDQLPSIIETAFRRGFTAKQVFDTITEKGEGLIPPWDLDCFIASVQKKLANESARKASETQNTEAPNNIVNQQLIRAALQLSPQDPVLQATLESIRTEQAVRDQHGW